MIIDYYNHYDNLRFTTVVITPIQECDQEFNVLLVGFGESSYGNDLRPFSP